VSHYEHYIRLCSPYKIYQLLGEACRPLLQDKIIEKHLWHAAENLFLADNILIADPRWPWGLSCGFTTSSLMGLRVRIPLGVWMSVFFECYVL